MSIPGTKNGMEEIEKDVTVNSFYLAQYPVTKEVYDTITKNLQISNEFNSMPVVNVSWLDTVKFCNLFSKESGFNECYSFDNEKVNCDFTAKGYRLPTDAEWQYACKANANKYEYDEIDKISWYRDNSDDKPHDVGTKQPNAFGLYDMLGNVWEWVYLPQTQSLNTCYRGFGISCCKVFLEH